MVRINLVKPKLLSDQHLIAEYNEMLMLEAYIKKYWPKDIPKNYCLGKGHMKFFADKTTYLKKRHELLKKEMRKRKFQTRKTLTIKNTNDWKPNKEDIKLITSRIKSKLRPNYYRYYGEMKPVKFFEKLL